MSGIPKGSPGDDTNSIRALPPWKGFKGNRVTQSRWTAPWRTSKGIRIVVRDISRKADSVDVEAYFIDRGAAVELD